MMKLNLNVAVFLVILLPLVFLSGCGDTTESTTGEKDYTGAFVADLPLTEQIKIARSVELSSVVNWGEGGPLYSREVAEAFLLDYPFPDYLEEKYGKYKPASPWEREKNAVAFLSQSPVNDSSMPGVYLREIWLYTGSGAYQIILRVDDDGFINELSASFVGEESSKNPTSYPVSIPDHGVTNRLPREMHPFENLTAVLPGFVYDKERDRYVHEVYDVWYIIKDGRRVIPGEQYIDPGKFELYYVFLEPRPDDVWIHVSDTEIVVQPGDNLSRIRDAWIGAFAPGTHYRMSHAFSISGRPDFLNRNNIKDPDLIYPGQVLVYKNYVDRDAPQELFKHAEAMAGRYYVGEDEMGALRLFPAN